MITELTEDTVADFIKEGKTVIRTWDEGCSYCVKYEPTFNEYVEEKGIKSGKLRLHVLKNQQPSAFKRAYMKQDAGDNIKETVPGTFVFENGELKARHFGQMSKEALANLVEKYEAPVQQKAPVSIEEYVQKATIVELKASISDARDIIDLNSQYINLFRAELARRQQPQKAS